LFNFEEVGAVEVPYLQIITPACTNLSRASKCCNISGFTKTQKRFEFKDVAMRFIGYGPWGSVLKLSYTIDF